MADNAPWYEAYPPPRNRSPPPAMTRQDLLARFHGGQKAGVDFLLVDLRRTDHEGGTIKGSLNLPAQTLYASLPTVMNSCLGAGIDTVIWYCNSSKGRGTRAAGWFGDLLADRGIERIQSVILDGGIAGWARAGDEYTAWMDEYCEDVWKNRD